MILLAQLTCYYYSFMILLAPLTRLRPAILVPLFAASALTQLANLTSHWNDDKYATETWICLIVSYYVLWTFTPKPAWASRRTVEAGGT
jgi:hypothetical protein